MDLKFVEAEVVKLNLKPTDTLVVKLKGDEFDQATMQSLQEHFQAAFRNNPVKVLLFNLPDNHDMKFEVVSVEPSCNTGSYCSDCNCGKKASAEKAISSEEAKSRLVDMPPEDEL